MVNLNKIREEIKIKFIESKCKSIYVHYENEDVKLLPEFFISEKSDNCFYVSLLCREDYYWLRRINKNFQPDFYAFANYSYKEIFDVFNISKSKIENLDINDISWIEDFSTKSEKHGENIFDCMDPSKHPCWVSLTHNRRNIVSSLNERRKFTKNWINPLVYVYNESAT